MSQATNEEKYQDQDILDAPAPAVFLEEEVVEEGGYGAQVRLVAREAHIVPREQYPSILALSLYRRFNLSSTQQLLSSFAATPSLPPAPGRRRERSPSS